MTTPRGVVALFIAPDGRVVAHGASFDEFSGLRGGSLRHAQNEMARARVLSRAMREMANGDLAKAISDQALDWIIPNLEDAGYRIETRPIGYEEE